MEAVEPVGGDDTDRDRYRRFEVLSKNDPDASRGEIEASVQQTKEWAKQASYETWYNNLSEDELEQLLLYKQDGYEFINPALRGDLSVLDDFNISFEVVDRHARIISILPNN